MAIPVNLLASAAINNVKFKDLDQKKGTAKVEFDTPTDILFFQDRPGIEAFSVEWSDLASKSNWNDIFGETANFHTFLGENNALVEINLTRPKQKSSGKYKANISISGIGPSTDLKDIDNIELFANIENNNPIAPFSESDVAFDGVPSGSDFMANTGAVILKAKSDGNTGKITIKGRDPVMLSYFTPTIGKYSDKGSLSLGDFSQKSFWESSFENENPNSVIAWSENDQNFQLAFKQSRPKFRKNGSWVVKGIPLTEGKSEKQDFIKAIGSGKRFNIENSTLMIDSTGEAVSGSINLSDVEKGVDLITEWSNSHPDAFCDGVSGAGAIAGDLLGAAVGGTGGAAAGFLGGAVGGVALLSVLASYADFTAVPEVTGFWGGGAAGAIVGGVSGVAALNLMGATFGSAGLGVVCDYVTGEGDADARLKTLLTSTEALYSYADTVISDIGKAAETISSDTVNVIDDFKGLF